MHATYGKRQQTRQDTLQYVMHTRYGKTRRALPAHMASTWLRMLPQTSSSLDS